MMILDKGSRHIFRTAWLTALLAGVTGCATAVGDRIVAAGDRVGVRFTCRLPDGAIASSTEKTVADDPSLPKAPVFLASSGDEPMTLPSGTELEALRAKPLRAMEEELLSRLVDSVVGMRVGESRLMKFTANPAPAVAGETTSIEMARVRVRPRELRLTVEEYRKRKGAEPAVGESYTIDPAFLGRVTEISGDQVVISYAAPPDKTVRTPFGIGTVREKDEGYEVELDVRKGRLVRSGPLVGRITAVDDRHFTIDYSHPFGGEELRCDVRVVSVEPSVKKTLSKESVPPVAGATNGGLPVGEAEALLAKVSVAIGDAAQQGKNQVLIDAAQPSEVVAGDLVTVHYTASLEDGSVFATTRESVVTNPSGKKVSWYSPPLNYAAEEVVAGKREILPGLGEAVIGLQPGEKKHVVFPPEKAFGAADPKNTVQFPLARNLPRIVRIPADEYVKRFSSFPVVNKEVDLVPYFRSRVAQVTEQDVALEFLAENGKVINEPYGTVTVAVSGEQITTTLKPVVGAAFPVNQGTGVITAADGTSFTVDFNNPLAGKNIVLDLEVTSLTKASHLEAREVDWSEDHDAALARAKKEGKPVFLILYADWCDFCKKLFAETLPDPRIKAMREKFVWLKVNSEKDKKYFQKYGQKGYPLIVLMNPDGTVVGKIDGFQDGATLSRTLKDFPAVQGKVAVAK